MASINIYTFKRERRWPNFSQWSLLFNQCINFRKTNIRSITRNWQLSFTSASQIKLYGFLGPILPTKTSDFSSIPKTTFEISFTGDPTRVTSIGPATALIQIPTSQASNSGQRASSLTRQQLRPCSFEHEQLALAIPLHPET